MATRTVSRDYREDMISKMQLLTDRLERMADRLEKVAEHLVNLETSHASLKSAVLNMGMQLNKVNPVTDAYSTEWLKRSDELPMFNAAPVAQPSLRTEPPAWLQPESRKPGYRPGMFTQIDDGYWEGPCGEPGCKDLATVNFKPVPGKEIPRCTTHFQENRRQHR